MSDFSVVFLPSWPHIHFTFSSIPRPVIHFFSVFCHHMFHLIFVLMYTACTEIWTLDKRIKSPLLFHWATQAISRIYPAMRLTWFEHAIYGLKARCHTAWLQTQINILFSAFRLLFSFCFSHYLYLHFSVFLHAPDIYIWNISWRGGTWTRDILVNGQALYLLSYTSIFLYWQTFTLQSHTAITIC